MSHTRVPATVLIHISASVRFQPTYGSYSEKRSLLENGLEHPVFVANSAEKPPIEFDDPWKTRDYFLSTEWEPFGWEGFSYWTGRFGVGEGEVGLESANVPRDMHVLVWGQALDEDVLNWKRLLVGALILPQSEWESLTADFPPRKVRQLQKPLPLKIEWLAGVPIGTVTLNTALDAMIASIQIDKLQGTEFRQCARPNCQTVFKLESRHERIYCSP
jgi:hypothetical protein